MRRVGGSDNVRERGGGKREKEGGRVDDKIQCLVICFMKA